MSWPPETTPSAAPGPEQPPTAGTFPPPAYYPPPAYPPPAAHNGVPQQSPWGETGLLAPGTFSPPPPAPPRDRLWPPSKREWTTALGLIAGLAAAGAAVAPLWVHLAPRLAFRVDQPGRALPVVPEAEEYVAADGRYVFITLAVGVVAALVCWLLRRTRGPLIMVALAAGGLLGAIVTWRLGLRLGTGYQPSDLQVVGKVLYQPLTLRARAALVVEPVAALIVYLLAVGFSARNDLGRDDLDRTGPGRDGPGRDGPDRGSPGPDGPGRAGEFSSGSG
ncbi:MAG TPA: hypothetical protein VLM05_10950 [Mycobacteriales bacterium]|nr:hypothetical protein [Mycobacteriales bacterium]